MELSEKTEESLYERCSGDSGSSKGRNKGQECMNTFELKAKIVYHQTPSNIATDHDSLK